MKILMVCLGNICRSPIAEGIMKEKIKAHNLEWIVDSAGTINWHEGERPDSRSIANAKKHNIDISNQRSRPFNQSDFENFDIIFAMDNSILKDLEKLAITDEAKNKLHLLLKYSVMHYHNVPDPYSVGPDMFENVFQLLNVACEKALIKLKNEML